MSAKAGPALAGAEPSSPPPALWRLHGVLLVALCAVVTVASWRTLWLDYAAFDDRIQLIENEHIGSLSPANLRWMFTDTVLTQRYTPLSWVSWAIVVAVGGRNAVAFHAFNLLVHLCNTVLVYFLVVAILRRLEAFRAVRDKPVVALCAALGTAVWALHPMRVEVIGWATQVRYGEAQACAIGAVLLYFRAKERRGGGDAAWRSGAYWGAAALYTASVLFYPSVIGLIVLFPLLGMYFLKKGEGLARGTWGAWIRTMVLETAPFALGMLLAGGMTLYARVTSDGFWGKPVTLEEFGLAGRVMQAAYVFTFYLWKPLNVTRIAPIYGDLVVFNPWGPAFLLSAAAVVGITVFLYLYRWRYRGMFLLWIAHLLLLAPVGGYFEHPHLLNDRYSYSHAVLFAIVIGYGLLKLMTSPTVAPGLKRLVPLSVAGVSVAFAVLSSAQLLTWQTPETTLKHILAEMEPADPGRRVVYWQLGQVYYNEQRFAEALEQCDLTLRDDPKHVVALTLRLDSLVGLAAQARVQQPGAIPAITLETARTADRLNDLQPHSDRYIVAGVGYMAAGRLDLARERLVQAVRLNPTDPTAHLSLAEVLVRLGDEAAGVAALDEAVRLMPPLGAQREAMLAGWRAAGTQGAR